MRARARTFALTRTIAPCPPPLRPASSWDAASRTEFAKDLGLAATGGTFSTYLSRLVSNGLADRLPDGSVWASDELFPGAGSGKA